MTGAVEPRPRGPGGEPQRKGVKVDKFGIFQVRRAFHLTDIEAFLLDSLARLADWRDSGSAWQGTISELHEDTGITRRAISRGLDVLGELGCIDIVRPFTGGRDVQGLVMVRVYEQLVMLHPSQVMSRQSARDPRFDSAPIPRPIRADSAPYSRHLTRGRASEQDKRDASGNRQRGEEEVLGFARVETEATASCDLDDDRLDEILERDFDDDAPPPNDIDIARYGGGDDGPVSEAVSVAWVRDPFGEGVEEVTT